MTIEIVIGVIAAAVIAYVIYQAIGSDEKTPVVPPVAKVIDEVAKATTEEPKATKKSTKKPASKKADKVDFASMKKAELLAHAKANGIKANASMNKDAILKAIKNG